MQLQRQRCQGLAGTGCSLTRLTAVRTLAEALGGPTITGTAVNHGGVRPRSEGLIPWRHHLALGILLAGFLCLSLLYSWATPILESGDEITHFPFVKHLADGGGLPVQHPGETE